MPQQCQFGVLFSGPGAERTADLLLAALLHDAGCGVAVIDGDGCVREYNDFFVRLLPRGASIEGRPLAERLEHTNAAVHALAIERVRREGVPVVVEGVLGGRLARVTYRPMPAEPFGERPVLLVAAPLDPDTPVPEGVTILRAEDPLAGLTPREREGLHHIGMGLPSAEIAKALDRSVKTIEGHRVSLGIKLGVSNRVQLARIAIRAGLAPLASQAIEAKPA